MSEVWKSIKEGQKELKAEAKKEEAKVIERSELEKEFFSVVMKTSDNATSKNKIERDSRNFRVFLNSNFSSNQKFLNFLSSINLSETEQEIKTFVKEYKLIMGDKISYTRYLNWNNNTIYKKRILLMTAFMEYFSDKPKRHRVTTTFKGIMGKALKGKTTRLQDIGTSREYLHKINWMASYVTAFIKWNCHKLRQGLVTHYEVIGSKGDGYDMSDGSEKVRYFTNTLRDTEKNVNMQYGPLRTFAFKLMHNGTGAFEHKRIASRRVETRVKKIADIQEKYGNNIPLLKNFLTEKFGYDLWKGIAIDDKTIDKQMTLANEILRRKKFVKLQGLIEKNHPIAMELGQKFIEKYETGLQNRKSKFGDNQ